MTDGPDAENRSVRSLNGRRMALIDRPAARNDGMQIFLSRKINLRQLHRIPLLFLNVYDFTIALILFRFLGEQDNRLLNFKNLTKFRPIDLLNRQSLFFRQDVSGKWTLS